MALFDNANYDFIKWRWHAIALSAIIIVAGLAYGIQRGIPLGIDFSGGTILVVKFDQPVSDDQVRQALVASIKGDQVIQAYGDASANQKLIRLPQLVEEEGAALDVNARAVIDALTKANVGQFTVISTEVVGPVIGRDLQLKGVYATLASLVGILFYIWMRFEWTFAVGAIVATFHDLIVTMAFLVFFNYDLSLNVIAAILTITGYSVNDTIVIFDRIRENRRSKRRESFEKIVNDSVNQTLSRTIITAGTTLLTVVSLYLFGGEVLKAFSFTMIVGIITGTYSSMYIGASIAIILTGNKAKGRPQASSKAS